MKTDALGTITSKQIGPSLTTYKPFLSSLETDKCYRAMLVDYTKAPFASVTQR